MTEMTSHHLVEAIDEQLYGRIDWLGVQPRLAILSDNGEHAPSLMYVGIKQRIARNLGVSATAQFMNNPHDLAAATQGYARDPECHAIIVQLPLASADWTEETLKLIPPNKDVDGLASDEIFTPATPLGIFNLIEGYDIDYKKQPIALIGKGKLVGAPLLKLLQARGAEAVTAFDADSTQEEISDGLNRAKIVISATGKPGLLKPHMFDDLTRKRVFIDAGAAESGGVVLGDISDELRQEVERNQGLITPKRGGVGPMTVRALLSNVVSAAEQY